MARSAAGCTGSNRPFTSHSAREAVGTGVLGLDAWHRGRPAGWDQHTKAELDQWILKGGDEDGLERTWEEDALVVAAAEAVILVVVAVEHPGRATSATAEACRRPGHGVNAHFEPGRAGRGRSHGVDVLFDGVTPEDRMSHALATVSSSSISSACSIRSHHARTTWPTVTPCGLTSSVGSGSMPSQFWATTSRRKAGTVAISSLAGFWQRRVRTLRGPAMAISSNEVEPYH